MLRSPSLPACIVAAMIAAACDETFEPVAPTDLAFSVFGYLDASADTQWVRVTPIRPVKETSRDRLTATVTLEHLGSGRIIELRDSFFDLSPYWDWGVGFAGVYLRNFWTPEALEPGATYRFSAQREGKDPAEAVVEIPRDYEVEVGIHQIFTTWPPDALRITGVKHLPFLTAVARFYDACGSSVAQVRYERRSAEDGIHLIAVAKPEVAPRPGCGSPRVESWELRIVGSETAWPVGGYSPSALGESGLTSNVTNAVGFLGGVVTKVIPYEACYFRSVGGAPDPEYCWLRYDPETATLSGTVSEPPCGRRAVGRVFVVLTEMDRTPARIRTVSTDRAGGFLIGALEPGVSHFLRAEAPPKLTPDSEIVFYSEHTDTLTFLPGQELNYDICLQPLTTPIQRPPAQP